MNVCDGLNHTQRIQSTGSNKMLSITAGDSKKTMMECVASIAGANGDEETCYFMDKVPAG